MHTGGSRRWGEDGCSVRLLRGGGFSPLAVVDDDAPRLGAVLVQRHLDVLPRVLL